MRTIKISDPAYDIIDNESYQRRMTLTAFVDHVFLDHYKSKEDSIPRVREQKRIRRPAVSA
jgi:hypothetical protein